MKMEEEKVDDILDRELEGFSWAYKFWMRDGTLELRNTGQCLEAEDIEETLSEFLESEEDHDTLDILTGKVTVSKEDGKLWKEEVSGEKGGNKERCEIDEDELKELFKASLKRVDSGLHPSNRVEVDCDQIEDIYAEEVSGLRMVNIKLDGGNSLTLRDDGGLHYEGF